jgi:hypothetical protein
MSEYQFMTFTCVLHFLHICMCALLTNYMTITWFCTINQSMHDGHGIHDIYMCFTAITLMKAWLSLSVVDLSP